MMLRRLQRGLLCKPLCQQAVRSSRPAPAPPPPTALSPHFATAPVSPHFGTTAGFTALWNTARRRETRWPFTARLAPRLVSPLFLPLPRLGAPAARHRVLTAPPGTTAGHVPTGGSRRSATSDR